MSYWAPCDRESHAGRSVMLQVREMWTCRSMSLRRGELPLARLAGAGVWCPSDRNNQSDLRGALLRSNGHYWQFILERVPPPSNRGVGDICAKGGENSATAQRALPPRPRFARCEPGLGVGAAAPWGLAIACRPAGSDIPSASRVNAITHHYLLRSLADEVSENLWKFF
jgi:hypothetical protein